MDKVMGIGLENVICYFFNYLESMKNSGRQKKLKTSVDERSLYQ